MIVLRPSSVTVARPAQPSITPIHDTPVPLKLKVAVEPRAFVRAADPPLLLPLPLAYQFPAYRMLGSVCSMRVRCASESETPAANTSGSRHSSRYRRGVLMAAGQSATSRPNKGTRRTSGRRDG